MENTTKILDFSSLENLDIPEIEETVTTKADETHDEMHEEAHKTAIEEVESIEELEDEPELENDDDGNTNSQETTQSNDEDPVSQIAKWGHELGILDYDEEEYKKYEEKDEYFKDKFLEKAKQLGTESLPPVIKDLAEKFIDGVPLDELIGSMSNKQRLENINDDSLTDNVQLQESLVSQYLALQDYDEEEIKTKLSKYKDSLLLEDEAKTALKKLKKYEDSYQAQLVEQAKQNQQKAKEDYEKSIKDLEDSIKKTETFIPGITMDKTSKQKLYDAITKRDRDGKTELEKKMSTKEMQLAVAQFVMQLDGKLDAVARKATTTATVKVKDKIDAPVKTTKSSGLDLRVVKEALDKNKRNRF